MSYQSKKLWDEVLDNLDPKYANEAAELFGRQSDGGDEEYGELVPVQAQRLSQVRSKKRIVGSIVGFAAAAAVLAVSVVTAVKYVKNDSIVQSDQNDSSVSEGSSTKEAVTYNILDDITLPTDPSLYSEDFSIYEKYFCGKWRNASSSSASARDNIYYVGYAPADNVLFGDNYNGFGNKLIGFYEDEHGAYMSSFNFMNDGSGEVFHVHIVFAPADDPDTLYLFSDYTFDEVNRAEAPSVVYVRDGEYSEENNSALNYFGVHKLCAEMGIDPELLFGDVSYDADGLRLTRQEGFLSASDNIIINYRDEDRLEYALKCAAVGNNFSVFYNISVTKENGVWGDPVLDDYTLPHGFADNIPENSGETDRGVLEEYFFGEWHRDGLLNMDDGQDREPPQVITVMYSDSGDGYQLDGVVSVMRGDNGAYAFTDDGSVYFVPENDRQLMYRFINGNPLKFDIYRMANCATADSRDLYGVLTELGRSRLFEELGSGFEDTYNSFIEYYQTAVLNGDIVWLNLEGEPYFLGTAEIGSDRVALVHKYFEKAGEWETSLVSVFEKTGGKWEYTDTYYDIDYDYTTLEMDSEYADHSEERLDVYENAFFGEWVCGDTVYNNQVVFSYSEEPYGMRTPFKGRGGYYFDKISGGAGEMYYIPYSDTDTMYFYNEGNLIYDDSIYGYSTTKRNYTLKYSRSDKQYDTELHDMMTLGSFGREKLFDMIGEDFSDEFWNVYYMDYIIDRNGVSWSIGLHNALMMSSFDPVLVSMDDDRVVISQAYIQSQLFEHGYYDDPSFEKGTLKNFILTFTKQDGAWKCNISDTGESIEEVNFSMDMSLFPYFIGVWSDGEVSYTLDFYNDFTEPDISWIYGFAETSTEWLMKVHRVAIGRSDIIPIESGDALFVIEKDDPATTKVYRYADALQKGEPLKTYTRQETLSQSLPDRGYISIYGLYALIQAMDSMDMEGSVITEYCISGSVVVESGERLYAEPSTGMSGKTEYVILERRYDKIKIATTFYSGFSQHYDYIVTFRRDNDGQWYMAAYEPAIYGLDGAEKLPVDNGCWYAFNEEDDGTHLYFYDSSDNIIYELDESVGEHSIYTMNGSDLFLLDCSENNIYRYINGRAAGNCYVYDCDSIEDEENVKRSLMPEFLQFSGEYLLAGAYLGDEPSYWVYAPYRTIEMRSIFTTDYLEVSDNGFTFEEDGELVFRNTADDSVESVLPLLELQHNEVWNVMNIASDWLVGNSVYTNYDSTIVIDGLHYYPCYNGLFPTYEDFEEYLGRCFTFDCAAELMIDSTSVREYNGYLYTTGGARGGNIEVAEVYRHPMIYFTDDSHGELQYEVYGYADDDRTVPAETPYETYRLFLVKTSEGWRFSNCYSPF
ncbi:MAG: hypothetical protein K2O14_11400 [Oscillospiraceae bacterium]|nr:hypothetical protein [Oscillospiraceae bacterium]